MTFAQPFKDYEILERIGSGAMGTVFKARQKRLDRIVALKVLKPSLARNTRFVDRLRREARIVASLNHPDIVAGYDLGEEGGYHFFVMEFVEGKSLATLLKEWGAFPEQQVLDVATRVASALDHAFKKGVIHRDVKPGNILIDPEGRAKLTDMGLAKAPEDVTITQDGATIGTPQYISPEQARDPGKADVRSDLYSLGATMFHMCTGQAPFVGTTLASVIHAVIHQRALLASAINPAVSEGLALVIQKLLAKDPAVRYQTPAELVADLHRVRRAEPPEVDAQALAAAEASAAPGPAVRRRFLAGALAALAAVVAFVSWPRGEPAAPVGTDPVRAFNARVQASVAAAEGWRGKLRALMAAAADATTEAEQSLVRDLRAGIVISWEDALVKFVRERRADATALVLAPEHWRDPARVLRSTTIEAVERAFGIARTELPDRLPRVLDAELDRLDAEVAAKVIERDQNFLAAFRAHLRDEVGADWRVALDASDFAGAERTLRAGSSSFFGEAGRPRRDQVSVAAEKEIVKVEEQALAEAMVEIERAESRAIDDLDRAAGEAFTELRELLRQDFDPRVVQQRYVTWRRELAERYPEGRCFRPGRDPWSRVADAENVFRAALAAAQVAADHRRVQVDVQMALGALLADGDATQEVRWLRERAIDDAPVRATRDRLAALFDEAHAARDWLLEGLATRIGGKTIAVSDPAALGRTLQIGVRRENGGVDLIERDGARTRRVSLAALRVSELIAQVPPPAGDVATTDAIDRGLALWLYCAAENSVAAKRLPPADSAFFGEHVAHAVQVVLRQRLGDEAEARDALGHLRRGYRDMPTAELRGALEGFGSRFGQTAVALASAQVLTEMRAHLRAAEQHAAVLATLRGAVPSGLDVVVDDNRARVLWDPARGGELPLGAGWQRRDDCLEFPVADLHLQATRAHAFVVADNLSTEHAVRFTASVGFAAQGDKPRLYLLEVHGVGVALGLTGSGEPFAAVVALEDLARDKVLQRELERAIDLLVEPRAGSPLVVVGARHALLIDVRVQAKRLKATVLVDGVEIATSTVVRPPKVTARVAVMPMQPLTLWKAAVEGQP